MNFSVVIATADPELQKGIAGRVMHPSLGMALLSNPADAAELAALLNTTEIDLVILDPDLPRLTKGLVKQIKRDYLLLMVSNMPDSDSHIFGLRGSPIPLSDLVGKLSQYRNKYIPALESKSTKVIAVAAAASGSGATSIAINMAATLSKKQNIMLIDFDLSHPNLAAYLTSSPPSNSLVKVFQMNARGELTPAELAQNCLSINSKMRILPGIMSAENISKLDFSLLDEIFTTAFDLDEILVVDLGQLIQVGELAYLQNQIIAQADQLLLVTAADPISMLTSCNWLTTYGRNFKSKLGVVLNKIETSVSMPELVDLIQEAAGDKPIAFFPYDFKLFRSSVWSGKIPIEEKPKSKFAIAMNQWLAVEQTTELIQPVRNKKRLDRLKQVS